MEEKEVKLEEQITEEQIMEVPPIDEEALLDAGVSLEEMEEQYTFNDLVDELIEERDSYKNKYLLALADFDNYKKRIQNTMPTFEKSGMTKVLLSMFQIVDDLERAIKMNENNEDVESLKNGFELIYKKFISSFESLDVKMIETIDKDFDTDYHEAVTMFAGTEEQKNKVVDCVQTGYTLNDKVIRHAKVVVGN